MECQRWKTPNDIPTMVGAQHAEPAPRRNGKWRTASRASGPKNLRSLSIQINYLPLFQTNADIIDAVQRGAAHEMSHFDMGFRSYRMMHGHRR